MPVFEGPRPDAQTVEIASLDTSFSAPAPVASTEWTLSDVRIGETIGLDFSNGQDNLFISIQTVPGPANLDAFSRLDAGAWAGSWAGPVVAAGLFALAVWRHLQRVLRTPAHS